MRDLGLEVVETVFTLMAVAALFSNLFFMNRIYDRLLNNHRGEIEKLGLPFQVFPWLWLFGPLGLVRWFKFSFNSDLCEDVKMKKMKEYYRFTFWGIMLVFLVSVILNANGVEEHIPL